MDAAYIKWWIVKIRCGDDLNLWTVFMVYTLKNLNHIRISSFCQIRWPNKYVDYGARFVSLSNQGYIMDVLVWHLGK